MTSTGASTKGEPTPEASDLWNIPPSAWHVQERPNLRPRKSSRPGLEEPSPTHSCHSQRSIPNVTDMRRPTHFQGLCRRSWWASRERLRARMTTEKPSHPCLPIFQPCSRTLGRTFIVASFLIRQQCARSMCVRGHGAHHRLPSGWRATCTTPLPPSWSCSFFRPPRSPPSPLR